jgi:DNA repair protein RadC
MPMLTASLPGGDTTLTPDTRPAYRATVRDMPVDERPRERLQTYGAGALNTAELLAIILRVGSSQENVITLASKLLSKYGGLGGLARVDFHELCAEHGLGTAKTAQLKAALEIGRRLSATQPEERVQIKSPGDAANLVMMELMYLDQEHLKVILLDTKNRVLGTPTLFIGTVNSSQLRVAEVFRPAIQRNCPSLIVVHNHPSGDPTPSPEDIRVTEQLVSAGRLLDIEVLDHLVIGQQRFVSLKERRLGFH